MEKLKLILSAIWKFVNSKFFAIVVIVLLLMIGAGECKRIIDLNQTINVHENNISALTDSLKYEKMRNGNLLVSIDGYIATEKELKTLNKALWDAVNDQKGKVIALINVVVRLQQDSTMLAKNVDKLKTQIGEMTKIDDSTYMVPWVLAYLYDKSPKDSLNYDVFTGRSIVSVLDKDPLVLRHKNSYMLNRKTQIELTYGEKVENGKLRIFITSPYPGFTVKSMEGVLIDPNTNPLFKDLMKKRHWFNGFSVGLGITPGINIVDQKFGLTLGPTFSWNIYTW
jgi:hypothetical protein